MKFETPIFFILLIPTALILFSRFTQKKSFLVFSFASLLKGSGTSLRVMLDEFVPFIRFSYLTLIVVALAGPMEISEKIQKNSEGIDIMLLLDTSDSMRAEDFQPDNRLIVAKKVLKNFISARETDRIGLIVFSGESYTQCPLTSDYQNLIERVSEVKINTDTIKPGTAIGMAIANAVARLKTSTAKSKVIVLLTDGENNTGAIDPITASELAGDENIKIYSIAIGKDGKVPYPTMVNDFFGNTVKKYVYMNNKIDTRIFEQISANTKGLFYRAEDPNSLQKIFAKIDKLEKTKINVQKFTKKKYLFPELLNIALYIMALELFFTEVIIRRKPA